MPTTDSLEQKIEILVREHLRECEMAAAQAVRSAFDSVRGSSTQRRSRKRAKSPERRASKRVYRSAAELETIREQLYDAICAHPGETMAVIASSLGMKSSELWRPSTSLRDAGRVRSVGLRAGTRYFPMDE